MLGGIDAEAVDAVVAHPLAQPVGQIIARRIAGDRFGRGIRLMAIEVWQAGWRRGFGFQIRQEGQRHRQVIKSGVVVIANIGADPLFTPPFFPTGFVAEVNVVVKAVPALSRAGLPVGPAFSEGLFQLIALDVQRAKLKLLHIGQGRVAGVVHHHVEQNADPTLVGLIDEAAQIVFRPHIGIQLRPVLDVIAVIGVMREIAFRTAADPAVDLFQRRTDP